MCNGTPFTVEKISSRVRIELGPLSLPEISIFTTLNAVGGMWILFLTNEILAVLENSALPNGVRQLTQVTLEFNISEVTSFRHSHENL